MANEPLTPEQQSALAELQKRRDTLSPGERAIVDEFSRRGSASRPPSSGTEALSQHKVNTESPVAERVIRGMWDELPNLKQVIGGFAEATSRPLETIGNLSQRQWDMLRKADQSVEKGRYLDALRYGLGFAIPVVGPPMAEIGDDPDPAHAAGRAVTFGVTNALPGSPVLEGRRFGVPGIRNRNPVENAAFDYLTQEGINVPAGTRTGNMFLRGGEQLTGRTIGGSRVAQANEAANAQASTALAGRLANELHPYPVTPEQAAQGVRTTVEANEAAAQADLLGTGQTLSDLVYGRTVTPEQAGAGVQQAIFHRAAEAEGAIRSRGEQAAGQVHPTAVVPEQAGQALRAGGESTVVKLNQQANDAYAPFHQAAKDPRFRREVRIGKDAQDRPILEPMDMPVSIADVQSTLRPLVEEWEMLVEPAKRNASPGFTAAKSIVNWEKGQWMPAELAEKALGGLKDLTRRGKYEGKGGDEFARVMRDENQGVASLAVSKLQSAIDGTATNAGADIAKSLREGRRFTAQKFDVADVVSQLRPEPVQAYGQMTYGKDAGIEFARSMAGHAPEAVPQVARALLDSLMEESKTSWQSAANKWNSIGESTKQLYFRDPAVRSQIDRYFTEGTQFAENQIRLNNEPVKLYQGLTAKGDSNIEFGRDVANAAPGEVPKVGRAFVDSLIEEAQTPGGWQKAYRRWQAMGEQTKQILYRDPDVRTGLEFFFEAGNNLGETALTRQLATEPIAVYRRLTRGQDAEVDFLRSMQKEAPEEMPKVGRAWLQGAIEKATGEGGWTKAKGILADWQNLGDETRKILFPNPIMRQNLDKFFVGTKKMADAVNPSGTAPTLVSMAEGGMWLNALGDAARGEVFPLVRSGVVSLGGYGLAKLLYSPKGTALLMRGMTMPAKHPAAALTAAKIMELLNEDANPPKTPER